MPTTKYIWDVESDNVLMETDENDVTTVVYTSEPHEFGSLISQRRVSTTSYYHYDALGSTRVLTDSTETVTDTYIYTAFGETVTTTGATTNPFRYVGEAGYYFDPATDDYYVRARRFTPAIARWSTVDPQGFNDGLNLYVYVHNQPLIGVDPSGLRKCNIKCCRRRQPGCNRVLNALHTKECGIRNSCAKFSKKKGCVPCIRIGNCGSRGSAGCKDRPAPRHAEICITDNLPWKTLLIVLSHELCHLQQICNKPGKCNNFLNNVCCANEKACHSRSCKCEKALNPNDWKNKGKNLNCCTNCRAIASCKKRDKKCKGGGCGCKKYGGAPD
jgi:RHS repeat-associated protein